MRAEYQSSSQSSAVGNAARGEDGHWLHRLHHGGQQSGKRCVVFPDVAAGFNPLRNNAVNPGLNGRSSLCSY